MIRGLLLDLEGVLYEAGAAVPGAREAVGELARRGYAIRFLTNTTTHSRRAIARHLGALGFAVDALHLVTPPAAAARLLTGMGATRVHLAAPAGLAEDFRDFELVGDDADGVDAIVLGDLHRGFTWQRLNRLFRLMTRGVPLIALHRNRVSRRADGISLDLGPFVAALEYAAMAEARVVGKPSAAFFGLALRSLGLPAGEVLMVGDDIEADVAGAKAAGLRAVQVMTGKYRPSDDDHPSAASDGRIASITDLPRWIDEHGDAL